MLHDVTDTRVLENVIYCPFQAFHILHVLEKQNIEWIGCEPKATEFWTDKGLKAVRDARKKGKEEKEGYEELEETAGVQTKALVQYSRQLERKIANRDRKAKKFVDRYQCEQ